MGDVIKPPSRVPYIISFDNSEDHKLGSIQPALLNSLVSESTFSQQMANTSLNSVSSLPELSICIELLLVTIKGFIYYSLLLEDLSCLL